MANFQEQLNSLLSGGGAAKPATTGTETAPKETKFSAELKSILARKSDIGRDIEDAKVASIVMPDTTGLPENKKRQIQTEYLAKNLEARGKHKEAFDLRQSEAGYQKFSKGFLAPLYQGIGDVASGVGSALEFAGDKFGFDSFKGTAERLKSYGETTQETFRNVEVEEKLGDFDWGDLFKPEFYHQNILRATPFTVALLPASLAATYAGAAAGAAGGAAVAGRLAMGAFGKTVLQTLGKVGGGLVANTVLSRPLESAIEAGQTYFEMLEKTGEKELALRAGDKVFKNNIKLSGLDTLEALLVLTPTKKIPFIGSSKLMKGVIGKTAAIGGKTAATGAMGATEEILQEKFSVEAQGEEFSLSDPSTKQAGVVGFLMGGLIAGGGEVFSSFQNNVIKKLPKEAQTEHKAEMDKNIKAGDTADTAKLKATEKVASKYKKEIKTAVEKEIANEGVKIPEQDARSIVEKAGAKFEGMQETGTENLVMFTDEKTGSTLAIEESKVSNESIKQKIVESRKKFGVDTDISEKTKPLEAARETKKKKPTLAPSKKQLTTEKPVEISGKKKESRYFTRVKEDLQLENFKTPDYTPVKAKQDAAKAVNFVEKNYNDALAIAMNQKENNTNIRTTTIRSAIAARAKEAGDINLQAQIESRKSLALTRAGQEVEAAKYDLYPNSASTFISAVMKERIKKAGKFKVVETKDGNIQVDPKSVDEGIKNKSKSLSKKINSKVASTVKVQEVINSILC